MDVADECEACGALFSVGSAWKPVSEDASKNLAAEASQAENWGIWDTVFLSFPIWGTLSCVALASIGPKIAGLSYFLWFVGMLFGVKPIVWQSGGIVVKVALVSMYCLVSAPVVFILGWWSVCMFLKSCH